MVPRNPKTKRSRSPSDTDRIVGVNIRKLRIERGMTLQFLASAVELSHQQLQKYETGANRLSVGMLPVIADALGVDMLRLFDGADSSNPDETKKLDGLRHECEIWLRRTRSEETLKTMARVLKALAT